MEMTAYEICQSYRNAASRNKQVKILAELNMCGKNDIIRILSENGIVHRIRKDNRGARSKSVIGVAQKTKRQARYKWTDEETQKLMKLHEKCYYPEEIAEIMSIDVKRITNKLANLERKKKGVKKNV